MTLNGIQKSVKHNQSYIDFITTTENGFANTHNDLLESIKSIWGVRDRLKVANNIAYQIFASKCCIHYTTHQGIFSGWISIYHFPPDNSSSKKLIDTFLTLYQPLHKFH